MKKKTLNVEDAKKRMCLVFKKKKIPTRTFGPLTHGQQTVVDDPRAKTEADQGDGPLAVSSREKDFGEVLTDLQQI